MKPDSATIVMRRPDGRILMQLRDDAGGDPSFPFPNTWGFPGGAVEDAESPLAAAVREMSEEFDVRIDPAACRQIWCYSHEHAPNDYVFFVEVPSDLTPVLQEGAAFAWMARDEIEGLRLGFGQARILEHIPPS